MTGVITCPNCRNEFEITSTLATQLREQLRKDVHAEICQKEADLTAQAEALQNRERDLEKARRTLDAEVAQRVEEECQQLQEEARRQAQQAQAAELQDLQEQLLQAKHDLSLAQQAELAIRKERRALEEQKEALELTVTRTLDEERAKIRDEAKRQADEEHCLKAADHDKLVADLRRQITDLQRKAEQGSLQIQGEVLEQELEDLLCGHFPHDTIEPVPSAKNGGDILHHVHDDAGRPCGTILWEAKRTKAFQAHWLPKLREDLRAARGHVAVLVSAELPKGVKTFKHVEGIWVTSRACVLDLASALRMGILEVARTRRNFEGRQTKAEVLYDYLAGPEFKHRVEGIVEAFLALRHDLESEKRSMRRIWNKREKHLDWAVANTVALHGDLGGILGKELPEIPQLELASVASDEMDDEEEVVNALVAAGSDVPF
jgi:hypothetical protein